MPKHTTARFGLVLDCAVSGRLAELRFAALGHATVGSSGTCFALPPAGDAGQPTSDLGARR